MHTNQHQSEEVGYELKDGLLQEAAGAPNLEFVFLRVYSRFVLTMVEGLRSRNPFLAAVRAGSS